MLKLYRLRHENIVRLVQTGSDSVNCYIWTDLCLGGELWSNCAKFGEPELRSMAYFSQILSAVEYMHRMGIVHRDIKAENVFLSGDCGSIAKLGDFGSSVDIFNPTMRTFSNTRGSFFHYVGTPNFMSPESINNTENDQISDIWSLGCLLYQILIGIPPFVAGSEYLVFLRVTALDLQFPTLGVSDSACNLIRTILQPIREKRPSLSEIRKHPFCSNSPKLVPPLSQTDCALKRLAQAGCPLVGESFDLNKIHMIETVRDWERRSAPGTGTEMLNHLNLPQLASSGIT